MKFFAMMSQRNLVLLLLTLSYCLIQVSCVQSNQPEPQKNFRKTPTLAAVSRSSSLKKNEVPQRTYVKIRDQQDLKEHGKRLIQNLMKNPNANAVLTCLATNIRTILENRNASDVIVNKIHIVKAVLTNHDAKTILKHFGLKIAAYLVSNSTTKNRKNDFKNYITYLSDKKTPANIKQKVEKVQEIFSMPMVREAIVSIKNLAIDYIQGPNLKERIAGGFANVERTLNIMAFGYK